MEIPEFFSIADGDKEHKSVVDPLIDKLIMLRHSDKIHILTTKTYYI